MATNSVLKSNSMVINYKVGVDSKGKDVIRTQRVKNISVEASDDNIIALSEGIGKLLVQPVREIKKEQVYLITKVDE